MKEAIDYVTSAQNNVTQTTIQNCWIKTEILSLYDDVDIDDNMEDFEDDEIENLLDELPDGDEVRKYFETFDHEIPTEDILTEDQIVKMVQDEENQKEKESDSEEEDDDNEVLPISVEKAINGLEVFIGYFE